MKNTLLTAFFFLFLFQLNAQQIALLSEPEVKISQSALNWENQKMRSDLTLTDAQFNQIKEINVERLKARKMVEKMFQYEPKKQAAKLREMESQFDGEFAEILTEKQFKKYLILQNRKAQPVEPIIAEAAPQEPSFNARIQEMISRATTPQLDSTLLPQQADETQDSVFQATNPLEVSPDLDQATEQATEQLADSYNPDYAVELKNNKDLKRNDEVRALSEQESLKTGDKGITESITPVE